MAAWTGYDPAMPARFWLHVNHWNNDTRVHAEGGCTRSRDAIAAKLAGKRDRNGWWEGPLTTRSEVDAAQNEAKKATNGDCSLCFGP